MILTVEVVLLRNNISISVKSKVYPCMNEHSKQEHSMAGIPMPHTQTNGMSMAFPRSKYGH